MDPYTPPLLWLADIDPDHEQVSSKTQKLGKLYQAGFPMLPGFVITNTGFQVFIKENNLESKIRTLLATIDPARPESVLQGASLIRRIVQDVPIPSSLEKQILEYYHQLDTEIIAHTYISPKHGFKQSSNHLTNDQTVLDHIRNVWIDQYDAAVLAKRHEHALDHITTGAEILILPHVKSEILGKMYTVQHEHQAKDIISIKHENDSYELSKKHATILKRNLRHDAKQLKLTHDELIELATLGRELESYLYFPQEITWAKLEGELFILETKPISSHPFITQEAKSKVPIARGTSITKTIASGFPLLITNESGLDKITAHHIVVVSDIRPHHLDQIKKSRGVINEQGELHSATTSRLRELGIPSIFNVKDARKQMKEKQLITIHAGKGEIYLGGLN